MQVSLCVLGLFRMKMGREVEPQQYVEKSNFLNWLDEAFSFMCIHISRDILFHLEGLKTPKEVWDKLEYLFGKHDDLRGHILENELIALQPNNFDTIQQFFSKYKALVLQCKQCGTERSDEQLVLSILSKIGSEFSIFVSTFHSKLEDAIYICFCRLFDPGTRQIDSNGSASNFQESSTLIWAL